MSAREQMKLRRIIHALAILGLGLSFICVVALIPSIFGGVCWTHYARPAPDQTILDRVKFCRGALVWQREHWDDDNVDHGTPGWNRNAYWDPMYDGARGYVSVMYHFCGFTYLAEPITGFSGVVVPLWLLVMLLGLPSVGWLW